MVTSSANRDNFTSCFLICACKCPRRCSRCGFDPCLLCMPFPPFTCHNALAKTFRTMVNRGEQTSCLVTLGKVFSLSPLNMMLPLLFSCYIVSDSFMTPGTMAWQPPLCMGFPRQEYWSGLPFPSLGDLPTPGMEPMSPALACRCLPLSHQGSPNMMLSGGFL